MKLIVLLLFTFFYNVVGDCTEYTTYEFKAITTESYSDNACSDVDDCQLRCAHDSTCTGYLFQELVFLTDKTDDIATSIHGDYPDRRKQGDVHAMSNGDFYVTIQGEDPSNPLGDKIYIQIFEASGNEKGSAIEVYGNSNSRIIQQIRSTVLKNDDIVVIWTESVAPNGNDVYAQRLNSAGVKQGSSFKVNPDGQTGGENYAYISALENGGFVIVWHSGTNLEVKAQRFDASATKVGSEISVNAGHTGRQGGNLGQNLVTFSDNTFAIVYNDDSFPSGADSDIVLQLFNADGTKNGNEILVNTDFTGYQFGPSISRFSDNSFVVSWTTTFSGSTGEIHYQRFDASGLKVGPEITVGQQGLFNKGDAYVKVLADDKFMIGYYTDEIGDDANYYNIYVRLFDNSGNQFGTETKVSESDSTGRERYLSITELSNNNIVFVWENYFVVDSTGFKKQEMRIIEVQETNFKKYNYAPHTYNAIADKSYSGNTCSDVDDCKFWCSYDSTCLGYTIPKEVDFSKSISVGDEYGCVILLDDKVKCWGYGQDGRLGLGDTNNRGDGPNEMGSNLPTVNIGTGKTAKQIRTGFSAHTCVILDDDTLKCWGNNDKGQLGYGDTDNRGDGPDEMGSNLNTVLTAVKKVSVGAEHTCAILNDNSLRCWGNGGNGRLGYDNSNSLSSPGAANPYLHMGASRYPIEVAAGNAATGVILDNGHVHCWGYGPETGMATNSDIEKPLPSRCDLSDDVAKKIVAFSGGFCVLLTDNKVRCWGVNDKGQCGDGHTFTLTHCNGASRIELGYGKTAKQISAGHSHICAVLNDDTVKCWGSNEYGQLGYGDTITRGDNSNEMGDDLPTVNLGGKKALYVSAGKYSTCALLEDNTVKCWGKGSHGQLGRASGSTSDTTSPVSGCCYLLGFGYGVESGTDGGFVKGAVIPKPLYSTEYNAIADKSYSGNTCSDVDDCQLACHDDSTCLGYSPRHFSATTELSEYEYSGNIAKFSDGSIVFPTISSDDKIWIQFYDSTGTIKGTSINLDSTIINPSQNSVMLTVLTNDDIVIVYNKPMTYRHAIAAKRLNSAGVLQGSEFTVFHDTDPNGISSTKPRITSLSNGGFIITWRYDNKIKGQIYDASATKQGSVISISDHVFNDNEHHIISFSDNTFLVTYAPSFGSPNSYDVVIQRFNSDGTKNGNEVVASGSDRSYDQRDMDIGVFSDESFVIVWKSINQVASDSSNDVYFQRFDSSGNKVGTETLVNTGRTSGMQSHPKVQTLSDNSFLVSYIDIISSTERFAYVRLFNNLGVQQGDEQKISVLGTNQLLNMIELTNTDVFIVWSRWMEEGKLKLRIFKRYLQYGVESGTDGGFVKSTSGFCDANCACFGSCSLSSCVYGCTDIDYKEYSSAVTIGGRSGPIDFTNPCKTCADHAPLTGSECVAYPEYDCASPATTGTFKLSASCTLSSEVVLTGNLEIIGTVADMDNLITITAATNKRHFKVSDASHTLTIRHLKLTGGGAGLGNTDTVPGGSIFVDPGELNLYSSEISGNKGKEGAGLNAKGDSDNTRNAFMNIYNSIIQNNEATNGRGGGIFTAFAVATIYNTKIDNNQAINDGGGMYIYNSDVTMKNTIISNNDAGPDAGDNGGGLFIYGGTTAVSLRQTSFINNNADGGDELYISQAPTVSLINTYFSNTNNNNNIVEDGGGTTTYATCSDNPCTETGFTGTCAADGTNSVTCPVTTLPACTDSERYISFGAGMGTCVALLEYDCTSPATEGFFSLSNDCTLSSEVELTGELNIRGKYANNWKARTLSFTNVNANHYTVQGKAGEDPTLRLCAGDTYVIERATAGHALNIKTGDVDQLTAAVTNGSPQSWTPNAGTYKYYCVAHPTTMIGDIIVENCVYTTITAAANKKHFQLDGATHKLTIRNLKLTGGDSSGGGTAVNKATGGGSIGIWWPGGGEVNVYSSEISGNKAVLGGGIRVKGASKDNRNAILNIYSSIIKNNEATRDGGGIDMMHAVGIIEDSTIDNNEAVRQGGGLRLQADSVTSDEISITNTIISNNKATDKGGGIYIQGGTVILRQTSINDNTATNDGNEIYFKYVPKVGIVNTDINLDNVFIDNSNMDFVTCANSPCTETDFTGACSADSEKLTCQPTVPCKSSQTINSGKDPVCVGLAEKEMSGPKPTTSAGMKTSFTSMKTKFSGTHKIARRQFRSTIKYLRQQIRALTKQRLKIPKTDMVLSTTFSTRMGTRTNVDVIIPKTKTKIDQADACTEADVDLADQTDAYDVSLDEGETSLICHGNTPKTKLKMTVDGELATPEEDKDTYEYSCWENNAWTVAVEVKSDDYYSCTGGDKYYINSHSGLTCELTPPRNADDTADVGVNNADCGTSLGEGHTCTITCSKCSDVQYTTQQTCTGAGEHWDVRETVSEPSCNADNDPSFTPGVCQCKAGYEDDGTGKCVICPAGESSTAGGTCEACPANSNSVAGGGCACNLNHRLNLVGGVYVCEACTGANTGRAAGDLISSATVTKCHCIANHKVVSNVCTPCTGSLRDAGDDPDGDDTFCVCDDNFFINDAGTCEACANGAVRTGGDVEGGAVTKCLCPVDHVVVSNVCTECGRGKYKPAGDDPSGIDTVCIARPGMDPGGLADQLGIEEEDLPGDPDSPDGTKYYTRIMYSKDGSLHINKYGFLVDDNGFMLVSKSVDSALHHPKRHHFRRGRHFLQTSLSSQWSIHVPSRYIDITITWDGSVIATTDLGRFHRIGQIKLNSFANPLGLNHYKTVKSRCSTANDFGFALGNWCEGSALDGKPHEYWVETEVSGTGHIGSPGYPGFGILET